LCAARSPGEEGWCQRGGKLGIEMAADITFIFGHKPIAPIFGLVWVFINTLLAL
jgi:hypothetical protein